MALTALHVAVALVFLRGFLLTRLELPDVSQCHPGASCSGQPPAYSKAVVLIVDAVRYDFLCGNSSTGMVGVGSLMPKTLELVRASVSVQDTRRPQGQGRSEYMLS